MTCWLVLVASGVCNDTIRQQINSKLNFDRFQCKLKHTSTPPHNRHAPKSQNDARDRRRYRPSFALTSETIVDGDTVESMP